MREDYFEEEEEDQVNLEKRKSYFYDIFYDWVWLQPKENARWRSYTENAETDSLRLQSYL